MIRFATLRLLYHTFKKSQYYVGAVVKKRKGQEFEVGTKDGYTLTEGTVEIRLVVLGLFQLNSFIFIHHYRS